MSGTTLFTLGIGDVTPNGAIARALTVVEAGSRRAGFGFLALVIGYLPVLYQGFSRREVNISLLDARAGSPPSAGELLLRHADDMAGLEMRCSATGSAGRPSSWRAISRIRCSSISARSTSTSRGSAR